MSDYWTQDDSSLPLFRECSTSVAAYDAAIESGLIGEHEALILEALAIGPAGKTTIGVRTGLTDQQVIRRMADLRRKNAVKPTGVRVLSRAGRREAEWRLT